MVLFRMREVVLRSSLSGNTLMMQPSSTWFRASFRTRCMDFVDTEGSDTICCVKIKIFWGQTNDLAFSQRAHQCEMDCQMQDGVLHAVQSRPHFLYRPNGALLRGLLGTVHGNRTFDKNAPLYGILEGSAQQPVHLMDSRAGKKPLFLLFGQFLLLSLDIRTAGRFCSGSYRGFPCGRA